MDKLFISAVSHTAVWLLKLWLPTSDECQNPFLHKSSKGPPPTQQLSTQRMTGKETLAPLVLWCPSHTRCLPCSGQPRFFGTYLCCLSGQHLGKDKRHNNTCHFLCMEGGLHGRGPAERAHCPFPCEGQERWQLSEKHASASG